MKAFESHTFEIKENTSRSDFLGEIKKFGIFSGVEFKCQDAGKEISLVREVGMLERLAKIVHVSSSFTLLQSSPYKLFCINALRLNGGASR